MGEKTPFDDLSYLTLHLLASRTADCGIADFSGHGIDVHRYIVEAMERKEEKFKKDDPNYTTVSFSSYYRSRM